MLMFFSAATLGICFFICIVNYSFQKTKYKYLPKEKMKELNAFNSPAAWMTYSILTVLIIGILCCVAFSNVYIGFSSVNNSSATSTDSVDNGSSSSINGN